MFDLDGTLLDSLPGIQYSAEAAFRACGLKVKEVDLKALIGPPIRTILSNMAAKRATDEQLNDLERAFRWSYDTEGWRMTPHYPCAAELLREMKAQGRWLFVVSNKPRHISVKILETEGTLGLFDEIVTRDSSDPPYSSKEAMLRYLLQRWEIPPGECLMIGDTTEDAVAASGIGIKFCLMTHGYGDVPEGSKVPVAFRLDHFSELMPGRAQE
jgi:phosphoglycolate phosphatase